jgi:hypothetical protein
MCRWSLPAFFPDLHDGQSPSTDGIWRFPSSVEATYKEVSSELAVGPATTMGKSLLIVHLGVKRPVGLAIHKVSSEVISSSGMWEKGSSHSYKALMYLGRVCHCEQYSSLGTLVTLYILL